MPMDNHLAIVTNGDKCNSEYFQCHGFLHCLSIDVKGTKTYNKHQK